MNIFAMATQASARKVTFEELPGTDGVLSVVHDVDVCAVGIEYPLASGPKTFTPDDLIAAVASQEDPAIRPPRVWLGHPDDQRFHAGRTSPVGSAEPALGIVKNMHIEDNGMTLVGDIYGTPTWLAKILSSAYPNRSIEGYSDASTVTGHEWGLVITDLALLGVVWPGVSTLDDLEALYSAEGPEGIEVEETMPIAAARSLTAQVNVDDVRRAFYNGALADMDISPWSWIRAMQLDPNEIIIDDDEGHLFRASFEVSGEKVTFGEPQEVKIKYVNAATIKAQAGLLVASMVGDHEATLYASRDESRPAPPTQEVTMTPEQQQLRAMIGLPADATDEQVKARIAEINAAAGVPSPDQSPPDAGSPTPGPGPSPPAPGTPYQPPVSAPSTTVTTPETPSPDQTPDKPDVLNPEPVQPPTQASALPPGMTAVPTTAWQAMQSNVQALNARHQEDEQKDDEKLLAEALRAGKVFPAQKDFYAQRLKDPQTRTHFRDLLTKPVAEGGLMENMVPVEARGIDPVEAGAAGQEAYPPEWLPELQNRSGDNTITLEQS